MRDAEDLLGPFGVYAYSVGFWAAVFAALLGVWQSVPNLYADFYGIITKGSLTARLNNRVRWASPVPPNHWSTNLLLIAILALFAAVGAQEVMNAL